MVAGPFGIDATILPGSPNSWWYRPISTALQEHPDAAVQADLQLNNSSNYNNARLSMSSHTAARYIGLPGQPLRSCHVTRNSSQYSAGQIITGIRTPSTQPSNEDPATGDNVLTIHDTTDTARGDASGTLWQFFDARATCSHGLADFDGGIVDRIKPLTDHGMWRPFNVQANLVNGYLNKPTPDTFGKLGGAGGGGSRMGAFNWRMGLITPEDLDVIGAIKHALAMGFDGNSQLGPQQVAHTHNVSYAGRGCATIFPATQPDGSSATTYVNGRIPGGSVIFLPDAVDIPSLGLSPDTEKIAWAFKNFGGFAADGAGGGGVIYAQWDAFSVSRVNAINSELRAVLWQHLRVAREDACLPQYEGTGLAFTKGGGTTLAGTAEYPESTPVGPSPGVRVFPGIDFASFTVDSDEQISGTTPVLAAGVHQVVVTTAAGDSPQGAASEIVVFDPPTITSISPSSGPDVGGNTITITGTKFTSPKDGVTGKVSAITIDGTPATSIVVLNDSQVQCVVPAGTAGSVDVVLTTPGGQVTAASGYLYTATANPPAISSASPSSGTELGGFAVTLFGTDFVGVTAVEVDGSPVSHVVNSPTRITIPSMPAHATGAINIEVINGQGSDTVAFTYVAAAVVVQPLSIEGTLTVRGSGLETQVRFGAYNLDVVITDDREFVDEADFSSAIKIALIEGWQSDRPLLVKGFLNTVVPGLIDEPGRVERIDAKRVRFDITNLGYDLVNGTVEQLTHTIPDVALKA